MHLENIEQILFLWESSTYKQSFTLYGAGIFMNEIRLMLNFFMKETDLPDIRPLFHKMLIIGQVLSIEHAKDLSDKIVHEHKFAPSLLSLRIDLDTMELNLT